MSRSGYIILNPSKLNFKIDLWAHLIDNKYIVKKYFYLPDGSLIYKCWACDQIASKIILGKRKCWLSQFTYDATYKWDTESYKKTESFCKNNIIDTDFDSITEFIDTRMEVTEENYKQIAREARSDAKENIEEVDDEDSDE